VAIVKIKNKQITKVFSIVKTLLRTLLKQFYTFNDQNVHQEK